jgi:dimethylaniline monooxygenase (N-oxide forming)
MRSEIAAEQEAMRRRYVASPRHTIQVDFQPYMRQLQSERRRVEGIKRPLDSVAAPGDRQDRLAPTASG